MRRAATHVRRLDKQRPEGARDKSGPGARIRLAPGAAERDSFGEVVLVGRLRAAIRRLNPAIPKEASS
jgi:hypothetical protein